MTARCAAGGTWTWVRPGWCWRLRSAGWTAGPVGGCRAGADRGRALGAARGPSHPRLPRCGRLAGSAHRQDDDHQAVAHLVGGGGRCATPRPRGLARDGTCLHTAGSWSDNTAGEAACRCPAGATVRTAGRLDGAVGGWPRPSLSSCWPARHASRRRPDVRRPLAPSRRWATRAAGSPTRLAGW